MTLLMLLSLIGLPNREVEQLPGLPSWSINKSVDNKQVIRSIRLSMKNVTQEQWSELSNALSGIGMRKQSETVESRGFAWFIEEKREGNGLKASVVYVMNEDDTATISVLVERCSQCTA